jgi:hypothetical protein
MKSFFVFIIVSTKKMSEFCGRIVLRLYAPPFLMRLIVELYNKVPGEYQAYVIYK